MLNPGKLSLFKLNVGRLSDFGFLFGLLCSLWFPLTVSAATSTLTPVADTYFEAYGSENKNFGSAPILKIDQWGGRQAFLRFDIAGLPRDKHLVSATLRLFITEIGFNEQGEFPDLKTCLSIFDVATPWTESGLTLNGPGTPGQTRWSQGPGIGGPKYADVGPLPRPDIGVHLRHEAIPLDPTKLKKDSWLELDLTDYLRNRVRAGDTSVNLLLRTSTLGRNYTFSSREAAETNQRPQLLVTSSDDLPDVRIEVPFVTNWKPSDNVTVRAILNASQAHAASSGARVPGPPLLWKLLEKPPTSKIPSGLGAFPSILNFPFYSNSTPFIPDRPGKYKVAIQRVDPSRNTNAQPALVDTADLYVLSVPPHPRLYVTARTLPLLRKDIQSGSRLATAFLNWTRAGAAGLPNSKFHDMGPHEGAENTALAFLLTGDDKFLKASIGYAQIVLRRPMREHFEDVHAATFLGAAWVHAMALHYDWCYDRLTPAHRNAVAAWLKEAAHWAWARSSAPIAHNDGGARQTLLASASLALLGDDPEAEALFRLSHENYEEHLLPWLNDGGRGGRSGDGGEYEGLHGFYIVRYAWLSQTGSGEDVFSSSPYYFNRLKHIAFGWYPRPLVDRNNAFSMREYYSPSGDHTRLGYVGDTQPYQSAAALCARYPDTPEAKAVHRLAGQWPTQWMQYTLRWAVLGRFESIGSADLPDLAYFDPGCNTVYMRSDWSDDAAWILFENAPFVSAHGSLDSGTFEIFKGDILAARTGNMDHANVGAKHTMEYLHRSIAANCLLIHDPAEKWKGFLGGAQGSDDGGGERTNFPLGPSADAATYLNYRNIFQRGQVTAFRSASNFVFAAADLTPAYNNPAWHGGKLNSPKVTSVTRQLVYLRGLDALVVFDRVSSTKPEFKKTWLLHSLGDLDVLDGKAEKIDDGEFHYSGATRAVIRYGWPKPVPSFGRCLNVTLLPENAAITKIGGRIDLPPGQTESFPGDQWHGKHRHHHIKDFWVNGTNYPPGNPPENRWFGEPGTEYYVPGTPDESGGRGKWRIEVSPSQPALDDVFLNVLCPRLGTDGPFPEVTRLHAGDFDGALISENNSRAAVLFRRHQDASPTLNLTLPLGSPLRLVITGLAPGVYTLQQASTAPLSFTVEKEGLLHIPSASGPVTLSR